MTTFTATEQALIDEAVRTTGQVMEQPWLDGYRLRALQREVDRRRKAEPPPKGATTGYPANRRVKWRGDRFATHEEGADGLPICVGGISEAWWADPANADDLEHLGPGLVDCGHCANRR